MFIFPSRTAEEDEGRDRPLCAYDNKEMGFNVTSQGKTEKKKKKKR